jgi:hypothetical protein
MPTPALYAVVDQEYMLPLDDAIDLLRMLARATPVQSLYTQDTPYKVSEYKKGDHTLRLLTTAQHAAIFLE